MKFFISPLDLNIEQNTVEVPHKPMVRLATPVFNNQGKKRGIVILNYYGREMLQAFATVTTGAADHIMLVNGEGYWLKSPKPDDRWGFMFKRPELSTGRSCARGLAKFAPRIAASSTFPMDCGPGRPCIRWSPRRSQAPGRRMRLCPTEGEVEAKQYVWKSVAHLSVDVLDAVSRGVWSRLVGMGVVLLAVFGIGSWKLAQAWVALSKAEAQMRQLAYRDMLTDLPNRASLRSSLEIAIDAWKDEKTPFAVIMMDLDGFKPVNDTYGHDRR